MTVSQGWTGGKTSRCWSLPFTTEKGLVRGTSFRLLNRSSPALSMKGENHGSWFVLFLGECGSILKGLVRWHLPHKPEFFLSP